MKQLTRRKKKLLLSNNLVHYTDGYQADGRIIYKDHQGFYGTGFGLHHMQVIIICKSLRSGVVRPLYRSSKEKFVISVHEDVYTVNNGMLVTMNKKLVTCKKCKGLVLAEEVLDE